MLVVCSIRSEFCVYTFMFATFRHTGKDALIEFSLARSLVGVEVLSAFWLCLKFWIVADVCKRNFRKM